MEVTFHPTATRASVLQQVSEEEIFAMYGVRVVSHAFCSPLRTDKRPTCRFYRRRGDNRLIMRDYTGHFWGDCFDLVQHVTGKNFFHALQDVAQRFRLGEDGGNVRVPVTDKVPVLKPVECDIRVKRMAWTSELLSYWEQFFIKQETLDFYRVSPVEQVWLNDNSFFWYPARKESAYCYHFGGFDYKIYFPLRTRNEIRFLHNNPNILQGWDQLPETGQAVVVTKSMKDVMSLHQFNVPAVAPMSESLILSDETHQELLKRFDSVFCLYDTDSHGIRSMKKMRSMGITPLFFKRSHPKDFTDFVRAYGPDNAALLVDNVQSLFTD